MDSGAHYYKCDFQVHTPRDLNWQGEGAATEAERDAYAREFVAACRQKGLDAVAITDHHDVCMFRYIRKAAEAETDEDGEPIPAENRLTVFPGMELTLGVPCQALLLLDADFPDEWLDQVVVALGISPAPDSEAKHAPVQRLEHIREIQNVYDELNKQSVLRNRFIVFPHVGEGGGSTILRSGFASHYKNMPSVGGFVDGSIGQHGEGNKAIVNGRNKEYGNKAIAVFQTSDNRRRDFADLGVHSTWVKWANPTAEALRQACLARTSRISHTEPRLPAIELRTIEVSNSKFLGPINLDFNAQYNAVIGGRGTGKSTILEYVRWALCDQPPASSGIYKDELADFQRRRHSLIEGTLLPMKGAVDITFALNEVPHVIRRKASGELSMKIGDEPFEACAEQNVRELLPIRAYSQKQLSAVGARVDELRRFVHAPIQSDLDDIGRAASGLSGEIRTAFDRVVRARTLRGEIAAHDIEQRSLSGRIESLRDSLKNLSPEDEAIVGRQSALEAQDRAYQGLKSDAAAAAKVLSFAADELGHLPSEVDSRAEIGNGEDLERAHAILAEWIAGVTTTLTDLRDAVTTGSSAGQLGDFFNRLTAWEESRESYRKEYDEAKARAVAQEEAIKQIQQLEARIAELNSLSDEKRRQLNRLGEPVSEFNTLRDRWKATHKNRAQLLEAQCSELSTIPNTRLRATLRGAADVGPVADKLKQILRGTRIRGQKVDSLTDQVLEATDSLEAWHEVLDELQELAWIPAEDESSKPLPSAPRIEEAGFTKKDQRALAGQLQPSDWLDLMLIDVKDVPVFEYQVRPDDYLPFENASPGQQATALLSILLLQDGPPLLIDQPEDDLNMRIISETVETLWHAKGHRQVIFVSHNANLVVNGDAELIICCDYRTTATESGGRIKATGAIDIPDINLEIAEVMEGGIQAFKLRYEKYGLPPVGLSIGQLPSS